MTDPLLDRRVMLKLGGAAAGLVLAPRAADAQRYVPPSDVDTGKVTNGKVEFPAWRADVDPKSPPPPQALPPDQRVGFAVVGLGRLSMEEILPAFAQSKKAKVVALVSGSPDKLRTVAAQHGIAPDQCYDYAGFDRISDNPAIKAVYVVLPNAMHREFTERAARAGKHVLCEKPMTTSPADARAMIAACKKAGVKLMVAYRIQYEPHNQRLMRFVREKTFDRLVGATMTNTQTVAPDGYKQWRHKKTMAGGGSLYDIGLYLINTSRFLTGEEPIGVFAHQFSPAGDQRYAEVEETNQFLLRYPSGFIANCFCSYGARDDKHQRFDFYSATADMPNAYQYHGQRLTVMQNQNGMDEHSEIVIPEKNQFAEELDHMAECVMTGREPRTPGDEGLQDQIIMDAVAESARTGREVALKRYDTPDPFRGPPLAMTS